MSDKKDAPRNQWSAWAVAELKFVEQYYGQLSAAEIGEKLGRSAGAVIQQASRLGLTEHGGWSRKEKTFLKKHYGQMQTQEIARRLGRSVSAVRGMVVKLKLGKGQNRPWTESEVAAMQAHYGAGIDTMMALLPDRTRGAIFAQGALMGLSVTYCWREEEVQILRKWYPEIGPKVASHLPGRTATAIKGQAAKLGLRCRKARQTPVLQWRAEELQLLEKNLTVPAWQLLPLFPGRTQAAIDGKKGAIRKKRRLAGGHPLTTLVKSSQ